jgi:aspartate racemase
MSVDSTDKSRCFGLLGGLGIGAGLYYYEKLARGLEAKGKTPDLVMVHASTPRLFEYVQANDREGLAEYLNRLIQRLQAAGAELAAIPAVTAHFCVRELVRICPVPLLNIFDPLNAALAARGARRVAVFGTRFVIESGLFGEAHGVEIVKPSTNEIEYIHNTYVELARTGKPLEEQHRGLSVLAESLIKRERLDAIVLAGTDLALLFNEANTEFPYFDCAGLHVEAILKEVA